MIDPWMWPSSLRQRLSRRDALTLLGNGAICLVAASLLRPRRAAASGSDPLCVVRPTQTEGPYFVDEHLNRSDIRSDPTDGTIKPGTPLALTVMASRISGDACRPLEGAHVDIWHCDAMGLYSDVEDPRFNTTGHKFLRGYQITDAKGEARFLTIYPGWYEGRTVHIHVKVRTDPRDRRGFEFTSQMYFDDAFTDRVYAVAPYASRGPRTARNQDDRIFRRGGDRLMVDPTPTAAGYAATFAVGLQLP
ncbi:MAG: intradiol ring-cleavage dioxygenase [Nitrospira sp.]|nr:intradiol ring-cleavage dioxygenase [Nitrospira sp.]